MILRILQSHYITRLFCNSYTKTKRSNMHNVFMDILIQEKNEKLVTQLAQMEKKLVTAETTLEATLQYESGQNKALASPRYLQNQLLSFFFYLAALICIDSPKLGNIPKTESTRFYINTLLSFTFALDLVWETT